MLDVSVEEAELKEQEARAALAESMLKRMETVGQNRAISQAEIDRARAEYDIALAQTARTKAIIERKTIRAPFRARVGISDVHTGQYLNEGTEITTLQGVDEAVHVDFAVAQQVAAGLGEADAVEVFTTPDSTPIPARIIAVDARIDPTTRNAMVRAKIEHAVQTFAPGASVRVRIPVGSQIKAVAVPVSALRKGPQGEHVFVIEPDQEGKTRAHMRRVQSGAMLGDEVLILSGLNPGELIAASGSFKLRENALVSVVPIANKNAQ
jgi:membrane fusion protein (multidrug efflux system)